VDNLAAEGFPFLAVGGKQRIERVGDVMYDAVRYYADRARAEVSLERFGLVEKGYALCTLHRQENTDDPRRLVAILSALCTLALERPVVLPLHPRTRFKIAALEERNLLDGLTVLDPLPYLEMQRLQMDAQLILTDSGGMQKEAYFHGVPCITLRDETEWVETVEAGWNQLVGADKEQIIASLSQGYDRVQETARLYGNGDATFKVLDHLTEQR
jgi:UDP-GlcNAc3NAcA epimerase